MALSITNSQHSFIRFNEDDVDPYCIWGDVSFCLPVYHQGDITFQFAVSGSEAEIAALCNPYASGAVISLVSDCDGEDVVVFAQEPERFVLSDTQVLFNWTHGLPNFTAYFEGGQCFRIRITIGEQQFCSNCLERITDDCFTAVVEYGNEDDAFGFKYCYSGDMDLSTNYCEPVVASFTNEATLVIPYTTSLRLKYGEFPTVQAWIDDGNGNLTNMGITITMDNPVTNINLDFGGPASGIVVIR